MPRIEHMFDLVPLEEQATKAAASDPCLEADEVLLAAAVRLEAVRRSVDAALGSVLAELHVRGTTDHTTGHRTPQWFSAATGCPKVEAVRRVRTAERLAVRLDRVAVALADGRISFEHARVLADLAGPRTADIVERCQDEFLRLAEVLPFERWRTEVAGLVDLADADGGHRPPPRPGRLRLHDGLDGALDLLGTLDAEQGRTVREALEVEADRLFRQSRTDALAASELVPPTRAELLASALVELCRRGRAAGAGVRAGATELTLVVPAGAPLSDVRSARDGAPVRLGDGTTRALTCDPVLRAVVVDSLGSPLDVGRRSRLVPDGLRRAVDVRDGGCIFPGCDVPSAWCDLHHVVHWSEGGHTSADNLASLCRHHHRVTHRRGWSMRPVGSQRFAWTTPGGSVLHGQRRE